MFYLTLLNQNQKKSVYSKKTKRELVWEKFAAYSNDQDAKVVITSEDTWSAYNTNNCSDGKKVYYRCNKVKAHGTQCNAVCFKCFIQITQMK